MSRYVVVRLIADSDGSPRVVATVDGFDLRHEAIAWAAKLELDDYKFYYDVVDTEERES